MTAVLGGRRTDVVLSSTGPPILDALLGVRPDTPFACRDGVCASCRCRVVEGKVDMDRCPSLDAQERQEGYVLACQAHPVTPRVVLDFDEPA